MWGVGQRLAVLAVASSLATPLPSQASNDAVGSWTKAADMLQQHVGHTATLLADGRVLVAGGTNLAGNATRECEIYDPKTNRWTVAGSLNFARADHTATRLSSGDILVVGGDSSTSAFPAEVLDSAEIYQPSLNRWIKVRSPHFSRSRHSAVLLKDGRVLVAGGVVFKPGDPFYGIPEEARAEIYDPRVDEEAGADPWSFAGTGLPDFDRQAYTLMPDGKVLATGGSAGGLAQPSAGLFDPAIDTWKPTTWPLAIARYGHTATLLHDGKVLLLGGYTAQDSTGAFPQSNFVLTSDTFDPGGNTGISVVFSDVPRVEHTATLLANGMVLIVGSAYASNADSVLFDPQNTEHFVSTGMPMDRCLHTATLLKDGRVLIAGGSGVGSQRTAWIYSPAEAATSSPARLPVPATLGIVLLLFLAAARLFPTLRRRLKQRSRSTDESEWTEA
jgi:hypothetical protein